MLMAFLFVSYEIINDHYNHEITFNSIQWINIQFVPILFQYVNGIYELLYGGSILYWSVISAVIWLL